MSYICLFKYHNNETHKVYLDTEDFLRFNKYTILPHKRRGGAIEFFVNSKILAREVLGYSGPLIVDHISREQNDCRKSNLRLATHSQSNANRKGNKNKLYSQYKGVSYSNQPLQKPWRATIQINKKQITKYFKTEKEAAKAYNKMATELFNDFAVLNDI